MKPWLGIAWPLPWRLNIFLIHFLILRFCTHTFQSMFSLTSPLRVWECVVPLESSWDVLSNGMHITCVRVRLGLKLTSTNSCTCSSGCSCSSIRNMAIDFLVHSSAYRQVPYTDGQLRSRPFQLYSCHAATIDSSPAKQPRSGDSLLKDTKCNVFVTEGIKMQRSAF